MSIINHQLKSDAFLLVSYGAPESEEEVLPFLENLFAGKNVPQKRIEAAVEKYHEFARQSGRYSPLNEECRALLAGILRELNDVQEKAPNVYWGNLFWHPLLEETIAEMARDGVQKAICFATSAFDSFAGNSRYAEALESARSRVGETAPVLVKMPLPFRHPLFIEAQTDRLLEALAWAQLECNSKEPDARRYSAKLPGDSDFTEENILVLFSAHSVPKSDADQSQYVFQLEETCRAVIEKAGPWPWELVFQSRSVGSSERWLGPDIGDRIREIAVAGKYRRVVVSPIGFFCENMETTNDLDLTIGAICKECGLGFFRAHAVGAHPKICRMIREMIRDMEIER